MKKNTATLRHFLSAYPAIRLWQRANKRMIMHMNTTRYLAT